MRQQTITEEIITKNTCESTKRSSHKKMNGMQILMINALNVIDEAEKESRRNYN
jgi:hypothetical protein